LHQLERKQTIAQVASVELRWDKYPVATIEVTTASNNLKVAIETFGIFASELSYPRSQRSLMASISTRRADNLLPSSIAVTLMNCAVAVSPPIDTEVRADNNAHRNLG
jgi:hypothetical protein